MGSFFQWVQQLNYSVVLELLIALLSSLLCIMVHECSHGLVAFWLGDDTAKRSGRLSLNPLRHIDPMGLVFMALVRFGWAKPVPVNPQKMKRPKQGMALSAIAGPISNVLLTMFALYLRAILVVIREGSVASHIWGYFIYFLEYTAVLSSGLAIFNLLPIPPLDGSKFLYAFLPQRAYQFLLKYERFGMILLGILLLTNVLDSPLFYLRARLIAILQQFVAPVFNYL